VLLAFLVEPREHDEEREVELQEPIASAHSPLLVAVLG
jgi:hypothetical protein